MLSCPEHKVIRDQSSKTASSALSSVSSKMRQDPIRGAGFGLLNRYKRFLAGVVFGGVATLGCWSASAFAGEINALRGSAEETDHTSSRPLDVAEPLPLRPSHYSIGRSLTDVATGLPGLGGYIAENAVESVLFRGSHLAVEDRETTIVLPNRPSLRRSMMHVISYESGLRGDRASVGQSVASALRGSYASRRAMENANAERARIHSAVANFLPSVNGSLEASRSSSSSFDGEKFRQDVFKASLEVTVPIFTSGVNLNTYRQARHVSLAADYSYLAEEYQVSLEAVTAHINLRLNRRIENTLKRNVSAMRRIQTVAQKLYEAGDASRTDVAIAAANVESAKAELDVARRTREETRADFESVVGDVLAKS